EAYAAAHDKGAKPHDAMVAAAGDRPRHQPGEHVGAHDAADKFGGHPHFEPHESPQSMTLPLVVLAVGSAVVGLIGIPAAFTFGAANINLFEHWLDPVVVKVGDTAHAAEAHAIHPEEYALILLSLAIAAGGIYLGRKFYVQNPDLPGQWAAKLRPLYNLSFNKWYWDWLLDVKGVEAGKAVNNALWQVDAGVVDGGVNGSGWVTRFWSAVSGLFDKWIVDGAVKVTGWIPYVGSIFFRTVQTGFWQNYALIFAAGLFIILAIYVYSAVPAWWANITGR
ncbi:MAG TPA: hypothetical protein VNO70_27895, partial [Blastocatellia bacterium]|nr:hypothetical protein [Blastocatellia bacterium]